MSGHTSDCIEIYTKIYHTEYPKCEICSIFLCLLLPQAAGATQLARWQLGATARQPGVTPGVGSAPVSLVSEGRAVVTVCLDTGALDSRAADPAHVLWPVTPLQVTALKGEILSWSSATHHFSLFFFWTAGLLFHKIPFLTHIPQWLMHKYHFRKGGLGWPEVCGVFCFFKINQKK